MWFLALFSIPRHDFTLRLASRQNGRNGASSGAELTKWWLKGDILLPNIYCGPSSFGFFTFFFFFKKEVNQLFFEKEKEM